MPKKRVTVKSMAQLDAIRDQQGNERMRDAFYRHCCENRENALNMLNDEALQYPSLYLLRPEISKLELGARLSARNRAAIHLTDVLSTRGETEPYPNAPENQPILRWMLLTGYAEENLGDPFDEVMDFTAILLVKEHHDKSCLHPIEEMIFSRHRRGLYTYDAEWAFFESRDAICLDMLAERLRSPDRRDVELARRMLGFIPCFGGEDADPVAQYRCVKRWLDDNRPFLRYTGENNQKGNPNRFAVAMEAKYLQKPLDAGGELRSLSAPEQALVYSFAGLGNKAKALLSECSGRLHGGNRAQWSRWIRAPFSEQLKSARRIMGEGDRH